MKSNLKKGSLVSYKVGRGEFNGKIVSLDEKNAMVKPEHGGPPVKRALLRLVRAK